MWEIDRKSIDKNEVENFTNFVEVRSFKVFFWNYLDINYVFQSICNLWALYGFNTMPCVISRWSPRFGFRSLCDYRIKSRLVPFHFGWRFPCYPRGKDVPWLCVGEAATHGAKRLHAREVLFDALSLLSTGGEKNLEVMGKAAVHGAKSLHIREDNIMLVVNGWIPWSVYMVVWYICDNLPYVRYYGFGIILLVLKDYNI